MKHITSSSTFENNKKKSVHYVRCGRLHQTVVICTWYWCNVRTLLTALLEAISTSWNSLYNTISRLVALFLSAGNKHRLTTGWRKLSKVLHQQQQLANSKSFHIQRLFACCRRAQFVHHPWYRHFLCTRFTFTAIRILLPLCRTVNYCLAMINERLVKLLPEFFRDLDLGFLTIDCAILYETIQIQFQQLHRGHIAV